MSYIGPNGEEYTHPHKCIEAYRKSLENQKTAYAYLEQNRNDIARELVETRSALRSVSVLHSKAQKKIDKALGEGDYDNQSKDSEPASTC